MTRYNVVVHEHAIFQNSKHDEDSMVMEEMVSQFVFETADVQLDIAVFAGTLAVAELVECALAHCIVYAEQTYDHNPSWNVRRMTY